MNKTAVFVMLAFLIAFTTLIFLHRFYRREAHLPILENKNNPLAPSYIDQMIVFSSLLIAYCIQVFLQHLEVPTPCGVFIIFIALLWGIGAHRNSGLEGASLIPLESATDILFIYVPVIVFNIAFCSDVHLFLKTLPQIFVIGVPVCLFTAIVFGTLVRTVVVHHGWTVDEGLLFGIFSGPVYPTGITYLLKLQSQQTKQICILLEGEALLSLIITDFTYKLMLGDLSGYTVRWYQFLMVILRFVVFGILTGWAIGIMARFVMRKMYSDKLSVCAICFCAPFVTYAVSVSVTAGCGAIAVCVVGIILALERTILPKDIEKFLLDFWEGAAFAVDVFVCLSVAMFIFTYLIPETDWRQYGQILVNYLLYYLVRFLCFLLFSPIISRLGYGMDLKRMIVCVWCGLKCPFSLEVVSTLLEVGWSRETIEQFQVYILGLYFFSLYINGSFTDSILHSLKMKEITMARQINMNNCISHMFSKRQRAVAILKMDRFLADVDWSLVMESTNIRHPYQMGLNEEDDEDFSMGYRFTHCSDCKKDIPQDPTAKEMNDMTREARMRVLKTKKMSYSRQFENGMISKQGIQILSQAIEIAMDSKEAVIEIDDLRKRLEEESSFRRFIRHQLEKIAKWKKKPTVKPPKTYWRRIAYHAIITRQKFAQIMMFVVIVDLVIMSFHFYYHPPLAEKNATHSHSFEFNYFLLCTNIIFSWIYLTEFIMIVLAHSRKYIWPDGFRAYFRSWRNRIDFTVLLVTFLSVVQAALEISARYHTSDRHYAVELFNQILDVLRLLRFLRLFRIFETFYPEIIHYLDKSSDSEQAFNYELAKSYIKTEAEILDMLPHMIDNKKIRDSIKHKIEADRILITKLLGVVQKEKPWIAITVKSKQAIRTILNGMNEAIGQLKIAGWIDSFEIEKLTNGINELHKTTNSIKKVQPSPPKVIFKEVAWMAGDERVIDFLFENVTVKKFDPGDKVFEEGDVADGIYIVVTGLFMVTYNPAQSILSSLHEYGRLPIVDYLSGTQYEEPNVDYVVSGNCLGELSILTARAYNCEIKSDTQSQVYVLTRGVLRRAMELSEDPFTGLECRIWKEISIRIALPLLLATPAYQELTQDQVKYALERAFVPNLSRYKIFAVTDVIEDIIVIEGLVSDYNSRDLFIAPCCIPRTVQKLILPNSSLMNIPFDITTKLMIIPEKDVDEYDVMTVAEETCEMVDTGSEHKCLQHKVQERIRIRRQRAKLRDITTATSSRGKRFSNTTPSQGISDASTIYFKANKSEVDSVFIGVDEEQNERERHSVDYQAENVSGVQRTVSEEEYHSLPKRTQSRFFNMA